MSDAPRQEIPLPKGDDDFEDLVLALFREVWQDTGAMLHGRGGQRQDGVDLYGKDRFGRSGLNGVQCKHHGSATPIRDKDLLDELRAEVEKAKDFRPPLQRFIFATTAKRSVALQQEARGLTELHKKAGLFAVEVLGWEDIEDLLRRHSGVLTWYRDERAKAEWRGHAQRGHAQKVLRKVSLLAFVALFLMLVVLLVFEKCFRVINKQENNISAIAPSSSLGGEEECSATQVGYF